MDFKVIKLDNVKFSYQELLDYYNQIVEKYQHLKWTVGADFDVKTHKVDKMYSWNSVLDKFEVTVEIAQRNFKEKLDN
jgi:hypothetical protein